MDEGMSSEKFFRIITYLKEAKSVTSGMTLPSDSRFNSQRLHLLGMLDRIQHLVVSLRADFIDLFYFKSPYEAAAPEASDFEKSSEQFPGPPGGERRSNVVSFDRRRRATDRRQLNTFLARDRRSGIVDRRQRRGEHDASTPFRIQKN